jgi:hypothetical protein
MHFCLIWFSDWPLFLAFSLAMHCFVLASSLFEAGDMLLSEPLLMLSGEVCELGGLESLGDVPPEGGVDCASASVAAPSASTATRPDLR